MGQIQAIIKKGIVSAQSRRPRVRQSFRVFRIDHEQLPQLKLVKFSVPNIKLDMLPHKGLRSESLRPQDPRYLIEPPGPYSADIFSISYSMAIWQKGRPSAMTFS